MLRKYFSAKLYVPLIKGSVSPQFYVIFEKLNFEGISTGADLTKMVKICIILNCAKKIFFCQNYLFHSSKEVFLHNSRQFWANWIFEGISTGEDLTKMVKICNILNCAKKIFFCKIICSPHQRKCFSTIFSDFLKIEFWRNIDRRWPYKNSENLYYLNLC